MGRAAIAMDSLFAVFIVVVAGVLAGLFTMPMTSLILGKSSWELQHVWLVYALFGNFVWPWLLAGVTCPHLGQVLTSAHHSDLLKIFGYGLGWGCGAVTFGL